MAEVVGEQLPPRALPGCGPQLLRNFREPGHTLEDMATAEELDRMELMIKRVSDYLCGLDIRHTIGRSIWRDVDDWTWELIWVEVLVDADIDTVYDVLEDRIDEIFDGTMREEDDEKFMIDVDVFDPS